MRLYSPLKKVVSTKNKVFLNERVVLDFSHPEKATHLLVPGSAGGGKTTAVCVVGSQFENVLFLDPKPGNPAWNNLKEIGEKDNWSRYEIRSSFSSSRHALKINVREVSAGVTNVLCLKKEHSSDIKLRRLLMPFFGKRVDDPSKTWNELERLLVRERLDPIADELRCVLSETDTGMSLEELSKGRRVVSISDFDSDNRGIGLMIGALFFYKGERNADRNILTMPWSERLMIECDEADTHAKRSTAIGTAMGYCFSQGRSFGITGCVSGTQEETLHTAIKSNARCYLFFGTAQERDKIFKKYGVDLDEESLNFLRDEYPMGGNCFLKAEDFGYAEPIPIHINYYYQQLRDSKEAVNYSLKSFDGYVK